MWMILFAAHLSIVNGASASCEESYRFESRTEERLWCLRFSVCSLSPSGEVAAAQTQTEERAFQDVTSCSPVKGSDVSKEYLSSIFTVEDWVKQEINTKHASHSTLRNYCYKNAW
jgi:hypothetical protein